MKKIKKFVFLVPIPLFLGLWELFARLGVWNPALLPPPSTIFKTLWAMITSKELVIDLGSSFRRAAFGFLLGSIAGIILGFLTGWFKIFRDMIGQLIQLFRPIPPIAIIPLVFVLFGIGEFSKYFIIFWGVFFPMWLNTHVGVSKVETHYIWAAKSLGASNGKIFVEVILPASSPFIVAGMRIGIAIALICLVAAEMAGASKGLGFRIFYSRLIFRPDKMIANIAVLGILGATFDRVFVWLRRKLMPWYRERPAK
jgi:NitT/TauT family transport system permease protein/sulfonate transport system permease protein